MLFYGLGFPRAPAGQGAPTSCRGASPQPEQKASPQRRLKTVAVPTRRPLRGRERAHPTQHHVRGRGRCAAAVVGTRLAPDGIHMPLHGQTAPHDWQGQGLQTTKAVAGSPIGLALCFGKGLAPGLLPLAPVSDSLRLFLGAFAFAPRRGLGLCFALGLGSRLGRWQLPLRSVWGRFSRAAATTAASAGAGHCNPRTKTTCSAQKKIERNT